MSELPAIDPEAFIARLAALDMAAAERAHAKFMAAEETKDVVELGRNYQRMARSLRQTLAHHARVRREAAQAAAAEARVARPAWSLPEHIRAQLPPDDDATQEAIDDLDAAVQTRIRAEYDPSEAETLDDELDEVFDDLVDDDFLARPLSEQVDAVMTRLRPPRSAAEAIADEPDATSLDETGHDARASDAAPEPEPSDLARSEPAEPEAAAPEAMAEPPPPDPPPPAPPPEPPPDPWPEPDIPPWEKLAPGQIMPGGTGW